MSGGWLVIAWAIGIFGAVFAAFFLFAWVESVRHKAFFQGLLRIPNFHVSHSLQSHDRQNGLAVDEVKRQIALFSRPDPSSEYEIFPYSEVIGCEVIEDGKTVMVTDRASQFAGALIGGVVFGGVGALAGALTGKKVSDQKVDSILLVITVNSTSRPRHEIQLLRPGIGWDKTNTVYIQAHGTANLWHSRFAVIVHQSAASATQGTKP